MIEAGDGKPCFGPSVAAGTPLADQRWADPGRSFRSLMIARHTLDLIHDDHQDTNE